MTNFDETRVVDFDVPDTCPVCDGPNFDEEQGTYLCEEAPGFCSSACHEDHALHDYVPYRDIESFEDLILVA